MRYVFKDPLETALRGTEAAFEDLKLFAALLLRIEGEPFSAPHLLERVRSFRSHAMTASQAIARLARVVELIEARRNPILAVLDVPLMYSVNAVLAAERWRRAHGKAVREWIDALGEIEALVSLAAYSDDHPEDVFPQIVAGAPSFEAVELGHPLIPAARCVRNSVSITGETRVLLVSGSNMSGKSTLLRAVGINVVLAMAGAPVRARRLRLTPLQVGASIRINDSLHEGSSRFYAEITRLRRLHDLTRQHPSLLFLLDELLQGTNSSDRRIGAEGIVRAFVERQAIGLISTHDLALTDIGGLPEGALHNVHFQDELRDGQMRFDFKLREGVVTRSNGIELMRAIGLEV
jgi:DNA mismatch repair ATPase MutS